MKLEQTIIITRPIEAVFAYRSALQNAVEWQRDVLASELATPGTPGVGTRGTERRSAANGVTEEWDLEITEFEQDRVLGVVGRCGSVSFAERHIFARQEGDTRYTLWLEMTGSPLPFATLQKKTVATMMNLKWQLEAPRVRG